MKIDAELQQDMMNKIKRELIVRSAEIGVGSREQYHN